VRGMGLAAAGVMGIKPGERDDRVIGLDVARPKSEVFLMTDLGVGKRTPVKEFPTQGRHGVGVVAVKLAGKQRLVGMSIGEPTDRLMAVTSKGGGKALKFEAAGRRGRGARGSTILKLKGGETVQRLVPMLPQFSLPEPEVTRAAANGKGRRAPAQNTRAGTQKSNAPGAAAKNGKKQTGRRK
jgi:DNA gyrase subunit A